MALLNEINVKGVLHPIVTDDGYYQEMTVGDAEQLVATTFTEDDAPYNFRTAGGAIDIGDRKQIEGIVGGTIAWNQLVLDANKDAKNTSTVDTRTNFQLAVQSVYQPILAPLIVVSVQVGEHAYVFKVTSDIGTGIRIKHNGSSTDLLMYVNTNISMQKDHVYMFKANFVGVDVQTIEGVDVRNMQLFDLTQMFGSTIADYIYSLEQANAGAGVAWFKKYFPKPYYAYNAGQLMSVKALRHITRGFNAFEMENYFDLFPDYEYKDSSYRCKSIRLLPNTTYCVSHSRESTTTTILLVNKYRHINEVGFHDLRPKTGQTLITTDEEGFMYIGVHETVNNPTQKSVEDLIKASNLCINISWDGERDGEYEEYVEHIYELDPDLELRGIPKLSAGNDLYYDGDTYESDGTVTRKYGVVDMGSFADNNYNHYEYDGGIDGFTFTGLIDTIKRTTQAAQFGNILMVGFTNTTDALFNISEKDKEVCVNTLGMIKIKYDGMTTVSAFKTAMSGVYLVYELAEPTEETADPYNGTQIVDDFGTEEFIDAGVEAGDRDVAIPVGHNSLYQPNLRAKLEMAPNSPEDNGYYVVYHHDGINEYIPLIIPQELPNLPSEDGTYTLKCTVASGSATLSFESEV